MTPLPAFPGPRAWRATALLLLAVAIGLGACGAPGLTDVQRAWCGAHPIATINAAASLALRAPSRFVEHKAEVEQATLDGNDALATTLIVQWVGHEITATDSDPHPRLASMPSWAADDPADFERACRAVAR